MAMQINPTDQRVAANVRAEMGRRALSQSALAERIGCTQQSLSRRLTGRTSFSVSELDRIADALQVSVKTLLGAAA